MVTCEEPGCGREFFNTQGLSSHARVHKPSESCWLCDQEFRDRGRHVRSSHGEKEVISALLEMWSILEEEGRQIRLSERKRETAWIDS